MNTFKLLLDRSGQEFKVERNKEVLGAEIGLKNHESSTGKAYIGFLPDRDIKIGDWLIDSFTGRYYICDLQVATFQGEARQLKVFYLTEQEYKDKQNQNAPTFSIQNAYGSVIGTHNTATVNYGVSVNELRRQIEESNSEDKEELNKIVALLEMITENQIQPRQGLLEKFSAVMEKNSWITSPISGIILGWLTKQVP